MQEESSGDGSTHAAHPSTTTDEGEDEEDEVEDSEDEEEEEDGVEFANSKELSSQITSQNINSTAAATAAAAAASKGKANMKGSASSHSIPADPSGSSIAEKRDLSGIVMDVVILGAPLCSTVSGQRD